MIFLQIFLQPVQFWRTYRRDNLRPDVVAGLTIAVILLPQAMAYALIAELPPQTGLYAAIVAAIVGALWGSSNHLQTGPTNAISLLLLSTLLTTAAAGSAEYLIVAGLMAGLAGAIQLAMGLARLGVLVNFVSHSVIVGFSSGAGILIAVQQLRHLLGLEYTSHGLLEAVRGLVIHLPETHLPTLALGLGVMGGIVLLRWLNPRLPGPLLAMVAAAGAVALLGLDGAGVVVIGELPRGLPPLTGLPVFDLQLIAQLSTGALAVAAIGLVEAMSIARSIAGASGQRLDSNQEFVGQGLANIAAGFFSGYPCSGSFTRSAVNYEAGGQTRMAALLSGVFVLIATLLLAPFTAYVPRAALAGVLILTAYSMINRDEIARIWRGARADAAIMIVTFLATLFLHLEFAVMAGILLSFGVYILKTSVPEVFSVVPDEDFRHFTPRPAAPTCPQLAILEIFGDLYFGAVSHVEQTIHEHLRAHPDQRFLLLRMHSVDQCDFSGIHALEAIVHDFRDRGGDVFLVRVHEAVLDIMQSTGFYDQLGADHVLADDRAVCIYECDVRTFKECQNLPKQAYGAGIPCHTEIPTGAVAALSPPDLWRQLCSDSAPLVVDVREPREYERGHVPQARLMPLPSLLSPALDLPRDQPLILVCRGGRRSTRAACLLQGRGYDNVAVLEGGMLAWERAGLLEAVDDCSP
jgi:SulP family sulfate permease